MVVLRPYQVNDIENLRKAIIAGHKRIIYQLATGGGKGTVASYMVKGADSKNKKCLMVADRRKLVTQLADNLRKIDVKFGVIMSGETRQTKNNVILASRDTIKSWVDHPELELPPADFVLVEECHLSMGNVFQLILAKYPNAIVIGISATPIDMKGRSLGEFWQCLVCGEKTSELVKQGHLMKPEVYHPPELATKRAKGEKAKGLSGDPVAQWLRYAKDLPTIAFCKKVTESLELMKRFLDAGIKAEHIDASASDEERDAKYARLKNGETKVLCSVKLLITGIDIPEVSCGIIWTKMGSLVEYLQSAGRLMRPVIDKAGNHQLKQDGTRVKDRCVILDHSGAAFAHGVLPGDDIEWTLDTSTTASQRIKEKNKKEDKIITCPKCSLTFRGKGVCPGCGHVLGITKDRRAAGASSEGYEATDEVLVRLTADQLQANSQMALQREWFKAIQCAIKRGGRANMALSIFKRATGKLPWQAKVHPMITDPSDWKMAAKDVLPIAKRGSRS
jgi:DNA repair protein RadD